MHRGRVRHRRRYVRLNHDEWLWFTHDCSFTTHAQVGSLQTRNGQSAPLEPKSVTADVAAVALRHDLTTPDPSTVGLPGDAREPQQQLEGTQERRKAEYELVMGAARAAEPMVARRWYEPRCSRVLAKAALRWQADVVVETDAQSFEIVIVGAGFNGLYQLKRLREAGWSVRLVEAGSGLGGVWHHNRYPGARVDCHVPNYEYSMPEIWQDWNWTERFPGREELVAYFDHVDSVWDLSKDIDLNTRINSAHFDDDAHVWHLGTDDGRAYDCQWLIMCTGFGSAPYVPDLPGLDTFTGICHHTAQWPLDGLSLDGKRVGIIGTGASGVQVAQEAAGVAEHLTLFQRNPVYALPMEQRALTVEDQAVAKRDYPEAFRVRNAPPGSFHDLKRDNRSALAVSEEERSELFEDRWAKGGFHFWVGSFKDTLSNLESNRLSYEFWREKTRLRIKDASLHESLAPTDPPYPFGTKRPSLEQNYYDIFDRGDVSLVDLKRDPLVQITETGVMTESGHVELDILVLATGFDANTGGFTRLDFRGAGGLSVADAWADGVDTHIGIASPGFPNMLMLYGPQSAASFCNGPVCAELQGEWVVEMLEHLRANGLTRFDTDPEHAAQWSEVLANWAEMTLFGKADSWYMGANIPGKRRQLLNMPNSDAYLRALADCADDGYHGFTFE